ncbi:anti-sigma-I factor RsgI2-like [Vitis riparia]|uniref:anti-sigma-I factor RsgI2-like n=1 Tax=Vitis riparia TaxID=96939 RepID=UPI00155B21BC|nr:anti-sigma-I factor RsgI2-like [Vitis riparia]
MDMAILDSGGGEGFDVDGITGGVFGVVGRAEGVTSSIGSIKGTVGVGALMSTGISTGCGSSGCSGYGISGCFGPVGASGSAPYAIILVHLSRVNISQQMQTDAASTSDSPLRSSPPSQPRQFAWHEQGREVFFPFHPKRTPREVPVQASASEPPRPETIPPPAKPSPKKRQAKLALQTPPVRRYLTRSGGRPLQKRARVESSEPIDLTGQSPVSSPVASPAPSPIPSPVPSPAPPAKLPAIQPPPAEPQIYPNQLRKR